LSVDSRIGCGEFASSRSGFVANAPTDTGVDAQSVPTECNGGSRDPKWLELTLCER